MTFTEKKKVNLVSFEFEHDAYKGNGEARISDDKAIQQINGTVYKESAYVGSFSSSLSTEGELKININGVSADSLHAVAEMINALANEVKAKYAL